MRLARETVCLLMLFLIMISYAPGDEFIPAPQPNRDNGEANLDSGEVSNDNGETSLDNGEVSLENGEVTPFGNEAFFFEEFFIFEEMFFLAESPDEEELHSEEMPEEEAALVEDDFYFEAPPLVFEVPEFTLRSLDNLFPHVSPREKIMALSQQGLRHSFTRDGAPLIVPNPDLEIDILDRAMVSSPSHLIETLVVVPYNGREFDLLDIYNALGRIEHIKDHPAVINNNDVYIFTESTRIEGRRNRRPIPDPLPATMLPFSETQYLRLREINFGNLFIRGDVSISMQGITYSMTNFTDVTVLLVPIMRAERFITILYLEPIREGVLIYNVTGFYLPGFLADRVNLTPNINRRLDIFLNWITEGLRNLENNTVQQEDIFPALGSH